MSVDIPAGVGEKMQYIVHEFNDNTIRFVLRYPERLDADALRLATVALVSSVDVLHASFEAGRLSARWHVNAVRAEDCFTHVAAAQNPTEAALRQALQPITADAPAQMRCVLVEGERDCAIAVLISHLCADGVDSRYLLCKLCEAYSLQASAGSCAGLAVKNGSRAVEQLYERLTAEERRALKKDPRTGVRSSFSYPTQEPGEPAVLRRELSCAVMEAAHARVQALGATVNDLLLTAAYYAFVEVGGGEPKAPVSLMSMMDLRRHCAGGDSAGLCNLTGSLATALPEGLHATFNETLGDIAAQTRRLKSDPLAGLYGMPLLHAAAKRLPMGLLLAVVGRLYGSMSVGMTNVGRMTRTELTMNGVAPAQAWFGGPIKRKPGMQISAVSLDQECALCIWGYATPEDRAVLQRLLDRMAAHVTDFAAL